MYGMNDRIYSVISDLISRNSGRIYGITDWISGTIQNVYFVQLTGYPMYYSMQYLEQMVGYEVKLVQISGTVDWIFGKPVIDCLTG